MAEGEFFRLSGTPTDIDQDEFFKLAKARGIIRSKVYLPTVLTSPYAPQRAVVRNCNFVEVSFSKTLVENIEFNKCTFERCLFIGSKISGCRFVECSFIDSNPYRIEFEDTFINPLSFAECLDSKKYQNIGVSLYQELLNNSRRQSQPDFTQDALYLFRLWTRYQEVYRFTHSTDRRTKLRLGVAIAVNWSQERLLGFGVRVSRFFRTALIGAALMTAANYVFAPQLGIQLSSSGNAPISMIDAAYFTVVTLTTIGYGDFTATTQIGRLVISVEGLMGLLSLAVLASMLYRKILP